MSNKVEIKKIVLNLGGKQIGLSMDEAKKLKALLGELFDEKVSWFPYPTPIIIEESRPYWYSPNVTWTSGSECEVGFNRDSSTLSFIL